MKQRKSESSAVNQRSENSRFSELPFYMDLVGHDILNNNQAVLSYLELILQSPNIDKDVKRFAEKASSHARASTLLVEDIKTIVDARRAKAAAPKTVDLIAAVERAEKEAPRLFPSSRVKFENKFSVQSALTAGKGVVDSLVMTVIVDAIRQSQSEDAHVAVKVMDAEPPDAGSWMLRVDVKNASLPSFVTSGGIAATYEQDTSKAVKMVGMLFARMVTESLGARFEAHDLSHEGKGRGIAFILILKKSGEKR